MMVEMEMSDMFVCDSWLAPGHMRRGKFRDHGRPPCVILILGVKLATGKMPNRFVNKKNGKVASTLWFNWRGLLTICETRILHRLNPHADFRPESVLQ